MTPIQQFYTFFKFLFFLFYQVEYADKLKRVKPLKKELMSLERQAEVNEKSGNELTAHIEHSIIP